MKIIKKFVVALVTFAIILTACVSPLSKTIDTYAATPGKIKSVKVTNISKKTINVGVGKKFSLKVKVTASGKISKTVKYKSSNSKVAYISKKGVIKGLKKGKTTITVSSKANPKKKATFVVNVVKQATKLKQDGKASTKITTKNYSYIEREDYVVYIDKGVTVSGDTAKVIDKVMATIEAETGLKFFPKRPFNKGFTDNNVDFYFDGARGLFRGINDDHKKLEILIVNDSKLMSNAAMNTIVFSCLDFNFAKEGLYPIAHELTHIIMEKNMPTPSRTLTEGYAVYEGKVVARKLSSLYPNIEWCYGGFPYEVTQANAEALYKSTFSDADDPTFCSYQYGYYLATYAHETYGKYAYKKLCIKSRPYVTNWWDTLGSKNEAEILKKLYGNNFFKDFATWYNKNKDRFDNEFSK